VNCCVVRQSCTRGERRNEKSQLRKVIFYATSPENLPKIDDGRRSLLASLNAFRDVNSGIDQVLD